VDEKTIVRESAKDQIIADGKLVEMAEKIAQFLDLVSKRLTVSTFKRVQLGG